VRTAARCHDIGLRLRQIIEADDSALRVAIVASGGQSHFVVDEALDGSVMAASGSQDQSVLRSLPRCALNSGTSEILNWVMTVGAMYGAPLTWSEYLVLYRTPAGTGIGVGFAVWG